MEVRTANLILDHCERDIELLSVAESELVAARVALKASKDLLDIAEADRKDMMTLDSLRVIRIGTLADGWAREKSRTRARDRWLWIVGAVAVVETVIIGVAVGTR
jgi:hypothetical protein